MGKQISIEEICEIIYSGKKIAVITGAGVSVASGIAPFRDESGKYRIENGEQKLHIDYFREDPEKFYKFYKTYFVKPNKGPNVTHITLSKLQEKGYIEGVVTQNIDKLHTKAGSKDVIEIHGDGTLFCCTNPSCDGEYTKEQYLKSDVCPKCGNLIRPDIVLYGETPRNINKAIDLLKCADVVLVLGASLLVRDIIGLLMYYISTKIYANEPNNLIFINKGKTELDNNALVCRMDLEKAFEEIKKYGIEKGFLDSILEDNEKVLSIGSNKTHIE